MESQDTRVTEKEKQVKREIDILSELVGGITDRIDTLLGRLIPVLRVAPPTTDCEDVKTEDLLVELAADVRSIRYTAENHRDCIDDALDRLEI